MKLDLTKLFRIIQDSDRLNSCERKVPYGSKETADKAVEAMREKGVDGLESYPCRYADHWHIGH